MNITMARGISILIFFCCLTARGAIWQNPATTNPVPPYISTTNGIGTNTAFFGTAAPGFEPFTAWAFTLNGVVPQFECRSDLNPIIGIFDSSYGRGLSFRAVHDHDFVGSPEAILQSDGSLAMLWGVLQQAPAFNPAGRNWQWGLSRNHHPWIQPQDEVIPMDAGNNSSNFPGMPYQLAAHGTNLAQVEVNIGSGDTSGNIYPAMQALAFDANANGSICWFAYFDPRVTDGTHWDYNTATKAFEVLVRTNANKNGGFVSYGDGLVKGSLSVGLTNVAGANLGGALAPSTTGGTNILEVVWTNGTAGIGYYLLQIVTNKVQYTRGNFSYSNSWLTATNTRKVNLQQRATYEADFFFNSSNAFLQVTIEDPAPGGGNNLGTTNTWICSGSGGLIMTNHYSFRVPPNGVVSLTNQGAATASVSKSVLTLE